MISDERQKKLANVLVDFSVGCKEGDKVWIDGIGCDYQLTLFVKYMHMEACHL